MNMPNTQPSKLDEPVTIHFKEDSIPGLRRGELTEESKQALKSLMLDLVGKDIAEPNFEASFSSGRNKEKQELRAKINAL